MWRYDLCECATAVGKPIDQFPLQKYGAGKNLNSAAKDRSSLHNRSKASLMAKRKSGLGHGLPTSALIQLLSCTPETGELHNCYRCCDNQ